MDERDASLLAPLAGFYAGRPLPTAEEITAGDVPPGLRDLLRAPEPLTPRLEERHGGVLALRVLERRRHGDRYARRVVLVRGDGTPVVLGAIVVNLARLAPRDRAAVLAEAVPFGHIVSQAVAAPDALLRVAGDAAIAAELGFGAPAGEPLYGRRRTIRDASGAVVASVVEILAPESSVREPARSTGS